MMFPNRMISESLSLVISSSWTLSPVYNEALISEQISEERLYIVSLIPGMHIASMGLLRGGRLLLNARYFGPNPTIQCNSKAPIDFTAGKIRPLVKGIFYSATLCIFLH